MSISGLWANFFKTGMTNDLILFHIAAPQYLCLGSSTLFTWSALVILHFIALRYHKNAIFISKDPIVNYHAEIYITYISSIWYSIKKSRYFNEKKIWVILLSDLYYKKITTCTTDQHSNNSYYCTPFPILKYKELMSSRNTGAFDLIIILFFILIVLLIYIFNQLCWSLSNYTTITCSFPRPRCVCGTDMSFAYAMFSIQSLGGRGKDLRLASFSTKN